MFLFVTRKRLAAIICALIFIIALIFALPHIINPAEAASGKVKAETNEERVAFLEGLGLTVENEPAEIQEVRLPEKFSDVYEQYNRLQISCGFDLKPYAGRTVTRYAYKVADWPGEGGPVYAEMLVYKGHIIGGDIHSLELGGFMYGLKPRARAA
jgi:hypothetical protein